MGMRESSQFSKFGKAFIAVISFALILGPSASPAAPSPVPTSTVISAGNGDLNDDGMINSTDGSILKRLVLGTYTGSYDIKNGDLNGDGKINSTDYSLLKRRILNAS